MTMRPLPYLRFALVLLALFCSACSLHKGGAKPSDTSPNLPQQEKATQIWQRLVARTTAAEGMTGPFRIAANLRYTSNDGETTRVSSLLWGNGNVDSPYPLRLDLLAGVGTVVAKVREDGSAFVAYSPDEKTAYSQDREGRTLASFGVPIPLSLSDLTLLLTGRSGVLFLPTQIQTDSGVPPEHTLTADGASFVIQNARLSGVLEVSATGAPLSWQEQGGQGWTIAFEPSEVNPLQPQKLRISHPKGYSALIVVKDISRVSPPYTKTQLDLAIPAGTTMKALDEQALQ